jgi:hypothetical protein
MCRKDCCRRHRDQQPHAPRGAGGTRLPRNRRVAPPPERACLRSNRVSPPAPAWLGVSWSQAAPPVVANGTRPSLHISALSRRHRRQFRQRKMEPLWSPVVATGGNRWQMGPAPKRLKQTKTVAVGCDRLPKGAHGKEGVSGSSPEEGFEKVLHSGLFCRATVCMCFTMIGRGAVSGAPRIFVDQICRLGWQRSFVIHLDRRPA